MPIETKTYKHYWTDKKWWQDEDYVEFPVLTYKKHYARTKTVERKIKKGQIFYIKHQYFNWR